MEQVQGFTEFQNLIIQFAVFGLVLLVAILVTLFWLIFSKGWFRNGN